MVEAAKRNPYLIDVGDRPPGVGALSVPVFAGDGSIGAITISGPASRRTPEAMRAHVKDASTAARIASTTLGHLDEATPRHRQGISASKEAA